MQKQRDGNTQVAIAALKDVRAQLTSEPERYATYTREYLGWGVFALMAR